MNVPTLRIVLSGAAMCICSTLVVNVVALDDCNGSTPKQALCGTASACQAPQQNPVTGDWFCPNQSVKQQYIQHQCHPGSGQGSTLCVETDLDLVCTKLYPCHLAELRDPETNAVISRSCAAPLGDDEAVDNSFTKKTDYEACRDTTGA